MSRCRRLVYLVSAQDRGRFSVLTDKDTEPSPVFPNIAYDTIINGDFSQYETMVRRYKINGLTESEAKKKAALEIGSQIAEDLASDVIVGAIVDQS